MTDYPLPYVSTDSAAGRLVTGTTSGLGMRFAKVLASCGASSPHRETSRSLNALAEEFVQTAAFAAYCSDMTDRDSIRDALKQAEEALGVVQILVNNAAFRCPAGHQDV